MRKTLVLDLFDELRAVIPTIETFFVGDKRVWIPIRMHEK
jgi:hypothetical protein